MKRTANKSLNTLNIQGIVDDAKCFQTVREQRWPDGACCAHGASTTVIEHDRDETQPERQRYRCRSCDRCFDDLTGTIFAGHHQPLRVWILCLYFMGLNLSNHPRKAVANEREHGVNFEEAFTVFDDPLARIFSDQWHSEAESREIIIGHSSAGRLLLVAFTEQPDRTLRVISARRATPKEQRDYEHRSGT